MDLFGRLGLDVPIIQAPMAGVQLSGLAITVSNAGGLGSLPAALLTPDALHTEVERLRAGTRRAFNLNFFCHQTPRPDPVREMAWRGAFEPYYKEFGIDPASVPSGAGRAAFDADAADVVERISPAVVSFHFGLPDAVLLSRVRATGALILSSATTVDEARWLEAHGVDAIIAQGIEAGGHRGMFLTQDLETQRPTLELVRALRSTTRLPIVAAGGMANSRDVRDALAAGAELVQVGTAYLCAPETTTSPLHRAALTSPAARETAITNVFTGRPARGIVNRVMRELGPMSDRAPAFPLAAAALAPLRARAEAQGRSDFSPLWAGTRAAECVATPAADITRALAKDL